MNALFRSIVVALAVAWSSITFGGVDHRVQLDDSGIWNRDVQKGVEYGTIAVVLGGAYGKAARIASARHSGRRSIPVCSPLRPRKS